MIVIYREIHNRRQVVVHVSNGTCNRVYTAPLYTTRSLILSSSSRYHHYYYYSYSSFSNWNQRDPFVVRGQCSRITVWRIIMPYNQLNTQSTLLANLASFYWSISWFFFLNIQTAYWHLIKIFFTCQNSGFFYQIVQFLGKQIIALLTVTISMGCIMNYRHKRHNRNDWIIFMTSNWYWMKVNWCWHHWELILCDDFASLARFSCFIHSSTYICMLRADCVRTNIDFQWINSESLLHKPIETVLYDQCTSVWYIQPNLRLI